MVDRHLDVPDQPLVPVRQDPRRRVAGLMDLLVRVEIGTCTCGPFRSGLRDPVSLRDQGLSPARFNDHYRSRRRNQN